MTPNTSAHPSVDGREVTLLPCPCCGGDGLSARVDKKGRPTSYRAFCRLCFMRTEDAYSRDAAVKIWNTRLTSTAALQERVEAFAEALEPSGATKAAYSGEIHYSYVEIDEFGDERSVKRPLDWTTIKEVMALIRARAHLTENSA